MKNLILLLALAGTLAAGAGELKLARVFQDNMVLQTGKRVAVWGTADAGSEVTVCFGGAEAKAKAGADGRWLARFAKPFAVCKKGKDLTVKGLDKEIVLKNLLVGEVWILAGQSNMQWSVNCTDDAPAVRLRANYPLLRYMFNDCGAVSETELAEVPEKAKWEVCNTNNAMAMSATGFYFAEKLMKDRGVPIGLIMTACGATQIQNWTPSERFEFDPMMMRYQREFAAKKAKLAKEGKTPRHNEYFSNHFNAKIAPISRMALRGVCWYQGETGGWTYGDNPDHPASFFATHLSNMIQGWQDRFRDENLWFVVWELPSQRQKAGGAMGWPQMRMQLREGCERAKKAVPVCIVDTGWEHDVHPHDKTLVGQRGAERAEREIYGDKAILAPIKIRSYNFWDAKRAVIELDPETPAYGRGEFQGVGFEVKVGGNWTNAIGRIDRRFRLEVTPVAGVTGRVDGVRYLWNGWDKPNAWIVNAQGYPLSSFIQERQNRDRETSTYKCEYSDWLKKEPIRRGVMSPGRKMNEDDFKTLKEWGATLLRYQMNCPRDSIRSLTRYRAWLDGALDHLDTFVLPHAKAIGMKVVIDMHSAPGGTALRQGQRCHAMFWERVYLNAFVDSWKHIATRFKGRTDVVYGYDLVNEPYQHQQVPFDYLYCQTQAAKAVRAIDPVTPIIIETDGNCSPSRFSILKPLEMKDIIYQVHMYAPMEMTHQQIFDPTQPRRHWPDPAKGWTRELFKKAFAETAAFERRHGAKIYVGEFSAVIWAQGADQWIADCTSVINEYKWDWTYHAFRESNVWSVEHEATDIRQYRPAADTPRKRALLKAMRNANSERTFEFPMEGLGLWRMRDGVRAAGSDGFISAKGNDFVDTNGKVRRFFGIGLYGPAQMPTKADAEKTAKQLSFWGFTAIRLMPQYVWQLRKDKDYAKGPDLDLLDRFDYFFAKLKERGIYATMNLHSARTAGYRFKNFKRTMKENKGLDNFDPTFIEHQKEWDKFIFNHVNPYTGLAYKDEPAVLSWEINNECSLVITWFNWDLWHHLTPPFKAELSRQFSEWAEAKYGSMEKLRSAWMNSSPIKPAVPAADVWHDAETFARQPWYTEDWNRGGQGPKAYRFDAERGTVVVDGTKVRKFALKDMPLEAGEPYTVNLRIRSQKPSKVILKIGQHERPYSNQGVNGTIATGPEWKEISWKGMSSIAEPCNRVQVEFKQRCEYEIANLSVVRGGEGGLAAGESFAAKNIEPIANCSGVRLTDVKNFILDVEDRYWKEMVRYLKEDLHSKQLVVGGTIDYGAGYPQAYADFIDQHFYYGGLAGFPGKAWDRKNWVSCNRLMTRSLDDGKAAQGFGLRVLGKPYTISEASQMSQTATASEFFPILFSLSAFQSYAAVYPYTWTHLADHSYGSTMFLDMRNNAKYLAHLIAARNMFVRRDVKSGFDEAERIIYALSREEEREDIRCTSYGSRSFSRETDPLAMVKAVTGLNYTDLEADGRAVAPRPPLSVGTSRYAASSTGEIVWDATCPGCEYYAVDTPRTKFLSQFGPAGTAHGFRDGTTFTLGETMMGWAAISLTETATNQFLLAATGWMQPKGAVVMDYATKKPIAPADEVKMEGAKITTMRAMGDMPCVCEGVRAKIRVKVPPNHYVRVVPLDGNAIQMGESRDFSPRDGFVEFEIGEQFKTVWYRVEFAACGLPAVGEKTPKSNYDDTNLPLVDYPLVIADLSEVKMNI